MFCSGTYLIMCWRLSQGRVFDFGNKKSRDQPVDVDVASGIPCGIAARRGMNDPFSCTFDTKHVLSLRLIQSCCPLVALALRKEEGRHQGRANAGRQEKGCLAAARHDA